MQLATFNVNSLNVRLAQVLAWLEANPVDVLCLQELKLTDDKFPHDAFTALGYQCAVFGQKTYNGVALISKHPLDAVVRNIPGFADEQARVIAATIDTDNGPLRIINGYFVNGQAPGSEKFEYKMRWLDALRAWLRTELHTHPRLALLGDFNITAEDEDSWDPEGLMESIHHTTDEREQFLGLLSLGMHDTFRLFPQPAKSFSWWDYRGGGFRRNQGLRIDYILVSDALKPAVQSCHIDVTPRKNEQPSDHTPVVAVLV